MLNSPPEASEPGGQQGCPTPHTQRQHLEPQPPAGSKPQAAGTSSSQVSERDWELPCADKGSSPASVFLSRGPRLLPLLSERKHFPVRSTQAAALSSARKHLGCSRLLSPATGKAGHTQQPARNGSDGPSHCGACSQRQTKALETARSPSDTPITSAQNVLRLSPSHPTKAGFLF